MNSADDISDNRDNDDTSPLLGSRAEETCDTSYMYGSTHVPASVKEPPEDYRSRWRSIRVVYLVMFLGSVTFTITMSSLWPFLQVLNPAASTSFLGWVVAAYSLGQLVASPIFGSWANLRNSSREPLAVSLVLTILSNIFYMYLETLPTHRDFFMILARGLIGFSAGNVAVVRSYVSGATTVQERTATMANLSIFQAMGFILGPVIQAALVPISYPGPVHREFFHFNMYTAPAFLAACIAAISFFLLIFVFREHRVYDDDVKAVLQSRVSNREDPNINSSELSDSLRNLTYKLDYVAVLSSIFLFFIVLFMFTVFETIGTPLTMHMYAWTKAKATLYLGIILGVASVLSIIVFLLVKILAKKYNERYLLLGGFIFCLCGYFTFIPWGSRLPPTGFAPINSNNQTFSSADAIFSLSDYIFKGSHFDSISHLEYGFSKRDTFSARHESKLIPSFVLYNSDIFYGDTSNTSDTGGGGNFTFTTTVKSPITTSSITNSTYASNGCPWEYSWCRYVPAIYLGQFLGGTVLISIGYPVCNMLSYALYSKVLGPKPQGLWMGWLTASGSLARTVGPIYVSQVYDSFGPQVTFGSCTGLIALTIVFYLAVFRRMVPFSFKEESLTRFGGSTSERNVN